MNGKAKGSSFERDISKMLSKWLTGSEKPYQFWRSPQSGGMATMGNAEDVSGDIVAIRVEAKWVTDILSVEIKNGYPNASFDKHLKSNKNNTIHDFWLQCTTDASKDNKRPMLIYRKKGYSPIVGIDSILLAYVREYVKLPISIHLTFDDLPNVTFFDMETFFKLMTPDILRGYKNG